MLNAPEGFLAALAESGFVRDYYALCRAFPTRRIAPCRAPAKEIIKVLSDIGDVHRLGKGRGSVLVLATPDQPQAIKFSFWVQYRCGIEACLNLTEDGRTFGSNYAVLAAAAAQKAGLAPHEPPYPRTSFYFLEELRSVVLSLHQIGMRSAGRYLDAIR
jgi:hypothetical protein